MLQLVYYSRSALQLDGGSFLGEMRSILKQARTYNERDGLTGFLLFDKAWFVQVLEGESTTLRTTYRRIHRDPRHTDIKLVSQRDVRNRSFPEWSMGAAFLTKDNEDIFIRHGVGGDLKPERLSVPSIVALAMDLQDFDRARRARAASAGREPAAPPP